MVQQTPKRKLDKSVDMKEVNDVNVNSQPQTDWVTKRSRIGGLDKKPALEENVLVVEEDVPTSSTGPATTAQDQLATAEPPASAPAQPSTFTAQVSPDDSTCPTIFTICSLNTFHRFNTSLNFSISIIKVCFRWCIARGRTHKYRHICTPIRLSNGFHNLIRQFGVFDEIVRPIFEGFHNLLDPDESRRIFSRHHSPKIPPDVIAASLADFIVVIQELRYAFVSLAKFLYCLFLGYLNNFFGFIDFFGSAKVNVKVTLMCYF